MVVAQLRDALVKAVEDAIVRGKHERVVRKVREAPEGIEEELERVRFRLVAPHRDVGGDARQDLVAGDEHAERVAPERRMLGRVAEDRDHFPLAPADWEPVAVHHAAVALRNRGHAAGVSLALARALRNRRGIEAVAHEEVDRVVGVEAAEVVVRRVGREIFRGRHPEGRAGTLDEPGGAADVIGMVVRDDDVLHRLAGERAREMHLPQVPRRLHAEARVDERPAVAVLEKPQVDVVERERQRHAQPVHARGDLDRLRGRGRRRLGVLEQGLRGHRFIYGAGKWE